MVPVIFSILAALLAVGGAIYQYQEKETAKKSAEDKQKKIDEFNEDLIKANLDIKNAQQVAIDQLLETDKKSQELIIVYKKLDLANEEIKRVQEETINLITGGPSFGHFVAASITQSTSGSFSLGFLNRGNYQLHDVTANIIDYMVLYNPEVSKLPMTEENIKLWRKLVDVQISKPNSIAQYGSYTFTNTNRLEFISEIWARNGHFEQRLKLYYKNGKWLSANKVVKWTADGKYESPVLLEEVDKDFPRLSNGQVNWENYNPYLPLE